jgi:hypothetical protein
MSTASSPPPTRSGCTPEGIPMVLVQMPMCNGTDTWGSRQSLTVLCTDGSAGASAAFAVLVADMLGGCGCGCEILGGGVAAGALGFLWRRAEENRALRAHANVAGDGGCGPDDDDDDGTEAFGRILATGNTTWPSSSVCSWVAVEGLRLPPRRLWRRIPLTMTSAAGGCGGGTWTQCLWSTPTSRRSCCS